MNSPLALVVGATGIAGRALCADLLTHGFEVLGLSRRPVPDLPGVTPVLADLTDPDALTTALDGYAPTHVFLAAWMRQDTEAENIAVNSAIVRNILGAVRPANSVQHVALLTGLKHYLGPFEAYGSGKVPDTPFHEDEPRLPYPNFYYAQEDELWAAAARDGFSWSVHRAHTIIGYAVGSAMNMGQTLAVQAAICRRTGRPFVFPGSRTQWNGLTDMTDAGLLAEHMRWAATTAAARDQAFNIVNGDVFRWRWMWPRLAAALGVEAVGFQDEPRPLSRQMADVGPVWTKIADTHGLRETDVTRIAPWWHTDGDLGRDVEALADMARSRAAGFTGYRSTLQSFLDLFAELERDRVIPQRPA